MSRRPVSGYRRGPLALAAAALLGACAAGPSAGQEVQVSAVAEGLDHPWSMVFLPDTAGRQALVTERPGRLSLIDTETGAVERIRGLPSIHAARQGGLLDLALHPGFPEPAWVYFTYSALGEGRASATHLARGRLDRAAGRLRDVTLLQVATPYVVSNAHYAGRITFLADGTLLMTTGDRESKDFGPDHHGQDTTNLLAATLRLNPDGSVPADNPFVDDPAVRDAIYTYGHRNVQAMARHPDTGEVWQGEHGENDGDEINVLRPGGNYGWPVASYARTYGTGEVFADPPHERPDTVPPVHYWPYGSGGFPPSGLHFYTGAAFPSWQGDMFMGNLAGRYLGRFEVDPDSYDVTELDPVLTGRRVRYMTEHPESGALYVLPDRRDAAVLRLTPAE